NISAGSIAVGNGFNEGAQIGGNVSLASGTSLFFRPGNNGVGGAGNGETMPYNGSITGSGGVTLNGAGNAALNITGGGSNFTGPTNVNNGKLEISADDLWSSASPTNVFGGATLQVDGN